MRKREKEFQNSLGVFLYLVQEAGEEGVGHVVVEEQPLVHQDTFDVLAEGWILTEQLHTRFSQSRLKEQQKHLFSCSRPGASNEELNT